MKPIHLNLAARPYRDYRPVYAVVVLISLATAYLMLSNIDAYYRFFDATRHTRDEIARIENDTRHERERADIVERRLATLDLRLLDDQTRFVNAKLRERSFSWSVLLDRLEAVLPDDVRILTIAPSFGAEGVVSLTMAFESKSGEGMIRTLGNLQRDPSFAKPFPSSERNDNGLFRFELTVQYFPPGVPNPFANAIIAARNVKATPKAKGAQQ